VKRCFGKRSHTPNYLRKIAQYGKVVFVLFIHLLILTGAPSYAFTSFVRLLSGER
jgi:hypothetical protein